MRGASTRRESNALISDRPMSPVNFLNFLNFRGTRKSRKFTSHHPLQSSLPWAFCRHLATTEPVSRLDGKGVGVRVLQSWG
jgi:hypothetical protein